MIQYACLPVQAMLLPGSRPNHAENQRDRQTMDGLNTTAADDRIRELKRKQRTVAAPEVKDILAGRYCLVWGE